MKTVVSFIASKKPLVTECIFGSLCDQWDTPRLYRNPRGKNDGGNWDEGRNWKKKLPKR